MSSFQAELLASKAPVELSVKISIRLNSASSTILSNASSLPERLGLRLLDGGYHQRRGILCVHVQRDAHDVLVAPLAGLKWAPTVSVNSLSIRKADSRASVWRRRWRWPRTGAARSAPPRWIHCPRACPINPQPHRLRRPSTIFTSSPRRPMRRFPSYRRPHRASTSSSVALLCTSSPLCSTATVVTVTAASAFVTAALDRTKFP